jgi:hypothetical protein
MDKLSRYLSNLPDGRSAKVLRPLLEGICDRLSSQLLTSGALVIKAGGGVLVKAGSILYATANGQIVTKAANTDMAALAGTVTAAKFNVFCFFIDAAGTLTTSMGTEGASLAAVKFPAIQVNKALIGFVIINPTGTGNFVGGTTALDDGTVIPGALYVNTVGAFDPSALV